MLSLSLLKHAPGPATRPPPGYMEACEKLRDRLLVTEWELSLKPLAMKQ